MATYSSDYFSDKIFDTDYRKIAEIIHNKYSPKTIAEFGCGNGYLAMHLADLGLGVLAVDGYMTPKFEGRNVIFHKVDLNNEEEIQTVFNAKKFDLAICMEVAEHLNNSSSAFLIKHLTEVADIVVFSAAVPGQGGHGHINCQPRDFWHQLFVSHNFILQDTLREEFRKYPSIADWYKYNTLVYVRKNGVILQEEKDVIKSLLASESEVSSAFYESRVIINAQITRLNYFPVKSYLWLRKIFKKLLGRG